MSMMIFGTLFFSGLFLMFVFILFGQEKLSRQVRRELQEQRTKLQTLENRVAALELATQRESPLAQTMSPFAPQGHDESPLSTFSLQPDVQVGVHSGVQSEVQPSVPSAGHGIQGSDSLDLFMAPPRR